MRHTSCHHLPQLEGRVETFLLQLLDLLPDRGLDLVLFDIDRSGGPARDELVYVDDDEPGSVSLRGPWRTEAPARLRSSRQSPR